MQCIKSTCARANGCARKRSESPSGWNARKTFFFSSRAEICLISSKARRVARASLNTLNHCASSRGYSQLMSTPCRRCASQNAAMARASFRRVASERVAAAKCFERPAPPTETMSVVPCPSHASRARRIVSASGNRSSAPSAPSLVGSSENKSTCVTPAHVAFQSTAPKRYSGRYPTTLKSPSETSATSEVVPRLASPPSRDQPMRSDARRMKSAKRGARAARRARRRGAVMREGVP